ncbi:putative MFS family arabinose efflux permease [Thermocatellispora tengchongensis]|uniref:Putative MFS family arabinose efflux permease n=1 Tax=Thermocatellispora tengchongensis TaxID=1073253 RepID=A0A840PSZ7_9ACTN|nr:MFS transporter [Thermocatellispora tengchongensis]MBB5139065.1 putative MFS family arabinose efflux permease [Thermocatellispora tengchongensis]
MATYRELWRTPGFAALFGTGTLMVGASTVSGLALGTLVFAATGSPLLSALSMFGPSLAQAVGATALLSAADRLPPRAALTGVEVVFALGTLLLAVPGLHLAAMFAVVLALGMLAAVAGGVRYGLLTEILPREDYLLGRSVLNMSVGAVQICGFAAGGALIAVLSPGQTLLAAAALHLAAAAVARFGLRRRPPRAAGRPSIAETWRGNVLLWSSRPRRYVYLALWVPNGLIVGCESLYVPYAPGHAGLLFACAALGMLAGDTLTGRFTPPAWRGRLDAPLRLLLAVPYLVFALDPALPVAVAAVTLASVGYAASLLLQDRLLALTPEEMSGHALGLHSAGMVTMQGVGAGIAGAVAEHTGPATAMAVMAVASVAVTLALVPGLRADPSGGGTFAPTGGGEGRDSVAS